MSPIFKTSPRVDPAMPCKASVWTAESIAAIDLAGDIRYENVRRGHHESMRAMIVVSYFDSERIPLGERWMGPWEGTHDMGTGPRAIVRSRSDPRGYPEGRAVRRHR